MDTEHDLLARWRQKPHQLRQGGIDPYPAGADVRHVIGQLLQAAENAPAEPEEGAALYRVAGRLMAINRMGKASFVRFRDRTGQMQAYLRRDRVGPEAYELVRQLDVGDIVALQGNLFRTRSGEWTLLASHVQLLCKSQRPLPEKYHGLRDPEKRYRRRYLDLIMNPEVRDIFLKRSATIQAIREFLLGREFLEVETPMMQPIAGGAEATPFVTHHHALGMDLFLRIAPELYLKRLVVGGFERVFEINRNFRNEGISTRHNPEFTMVEFYQAYATYTDLMAMTEELFRHVAMRVLGRTTLSYQGQSIELAGPWRRLGLIEALSAVGGIDPTSLQDRESLLAVAQQRGVQITKSGRGGKVITKLFEALVEPQLVQPTFITGYPVEVSPLSRRSDADPRFTDRFELFIGGSEIANGFTELNDPEDQRERFLQQVSDRQAGDAEAHEMDSDYIEALEYGLPPTAGEGIGIDRLVMLLTDAASIREVILFPHMKRAARLAEEAQEP